MILLIGEQQTAGHEADEDHLSRALRSSPPQRVLQILNSPDPGGVLALAEGIARGIAAHGFSMDTVFIAPEPDGNAWRKIRGALAAARTIVTGGHEAVIAYQAWPSIVVALAGLLVPAKRRIVHQTTVPAATRAPLRFLDKALGTLGLHPVNIVNTVFTRGEFDRYPRRYRRHLRLIEHGVERPRVTRSRADTLARYGIPDGDRILLNTGRLVEQKNQDVIIRALPAHPDCRLVIAGEGALRDDYEALARGLGVTDRVHLLGAIPHGEAIQLYGAADLFVFPSVHETFGISAVEAALLGLPTIVADIAVLREVLTVDGRSAVSFVDPMDVAGWTAAIAAPPKPTSEREAFAAALGRRYSEERMIGAYVELLNQPSR